MKQIEAEFKALDQQIDEMKERVRVILGESYHTLGTLEFIEDLLNIRGASFSTEKATELRNVRRVTEKLDINDIAHLSNAYGYQIEED